MTTRQSTRWAVRRSMGGRVIMAASGFSCTSASAFSMPVPIEIAIISNEPSGVGTAKNTLAATVHISPHVPPTIRYRHTFFKLSLTTRPVSTALMIEAKLSSSRTMSPASRATSVPDCIAMPRSAWVRRSLRPR